MNRANDTHRRSFRDAAVPVGDSRAIEEPEMLNRVEASDLGVVEARVREERAVGQ